MAPPINRCVVVVLLVCRSQQGASHMPPSLSSTTPIERQLGDLDRLTGSWQKISGLNPSVGNGLIGWVVGTDSVFSAGLFCAVRHLLLFQGAQRCRIALPPVLNTTIAGALSLGLSLDLRRAVVTESLALPNGARAQRRWYAHRLVPSVLVLEVEVDNRNGTAPFAAELDTVPVRESTDLRLSPVAPSQLPDGAEALVGRNVQPEKGAAVANVAIVSSAAVTNVTVGAGQSRTLAYLVSIQTDVPRLNASRSSPRSPRSSRSSRSSPLAAAKANWVAARASFRVGTLLATHARAWDRLWEGGVDVEGNESLARQINASLYYLLSSTRADVPYPLGPGGLPTNGYWGKSPWPPRPRLPV